MAAFCAQTTDERSAELNALMVKIWRVVNIDWEARKWIKGES